MTRCSSCRIRALCLMAGLASVVGSTQTRDAYVLELMCELAGAVA